MYDGQAVLSRTDITVSMVVVGLTVIAGIFIIWSMIRIWRNPTVITFYALSLVIITVSLFSQTISQGIGSLRVNYILLPIELLGIATWWGSRGNEWKLIPAMAVWAVIYH